MSRGSKRPSSKEMFSREFEVVVFALDEDQGVGGGYLRGEVSISGITLPFTGVAFGRFGGHNISIEFAQSRAELQRTLHLDAQDIENFTTAVQVRIIQGEMDLQNREGHKHDLSQGLNPDPNPSKEKGSSHQESE